MGTTSWRGQIDRALRAIDHIGESKYAAKQEQGWQPGEAVVGLFSHGYRNTVFDRAVTFTHLHELRNRLSVHATFLHNVRPPGDK